MIELPIGIKQKIRNISDEFVEFLKSFYVSIDAKQKFEMSVLC